MEELGSLITAERKEQMVHSLRKEVQSCEEKYKMYNEINHYVAEMVPRLMPTGHVLPEKDGVLRYVRYKRHKQEVKKKLHEQILSVVEELPTTSDDHEEHDEDLRGRHSMTGEEILDLCGFDTKVLKRKRDN